MLANNSKYSYTNFYSDTKLNKKIKQLKGRNMRFQIYQYFQDVPFDAGSRLDRVRDVPDRGTGIQ